VGASGAAEEKLPAPVGEPKANYVPPRLAVATATADQLANALASVAKRRTAAATAAGTAIAAANVAVTHPN